MFLSREDEMNADAILESRSAGQGSSEGLREREGEESTTGIMSPEEDLRRLWFDN